MPTSLPRLTPARQSTVGTFGSLVSRAGQAIQPPKAKTKRTAEGGALFSCVLNKDPEASKYMPYDEVAYPSLVRKARDVGELPESAPQELEHLYFANHLGLLAEDGAEARASLVQAVPSSSWWQDAAGAALEMRKHSERQRTVARREAAQQKQDSERDFLGFKKKAAFATTK